MPFALRYELDREPFTKRWYVKGVYLTELRFTAGGLELSLEEPTAPSFGEDVTGVWLFVHHTGDEGDAQYSITVETDPEDTESDADKTCIKLYETLKLYPVRDTRNNLHNVLFYR